MSPDTAVSHLLSTTHTALQHPLTHQTVLVPGVGTHLAHGSQQAGVAVGPGDLAHVAFHLSVQVQPGGLGLTREGPSETPT